MAVAAPKSSHLIAGDITRILAIIGVVIIHSADYIVYANVYDQGYSWWLANILRSAARTAVPLFIMLSGYLMLGRAQPYTRKDLIKKTIWRLGLPLIFWYLANLGWQAFHWQAPVTPIQSLINFLETNIFHLYYLQVLIGLYLALPLIIHWDKKIPRARKPLIALGLFIYACLITLFTDAIKARWLINMFTIFTVYLGYFYAGYLCRGVKLGKGALMVLGSAAGLIAVGSAGGSRIPFFNNDQYRGNYSNPFVVGMSICLFLVILAGEKFLGKYFSGKWAVIWTRLAANAYGIYLIHPIIKDIVEGNILIIHQVESRLWLYLLENIFLVVLISLAITMIGRRLPGVKKVFGEA